MKGIKESNPVKKILEKKKSSTINISEHTSLMIKKI